MPRKKEIPHRLQLPTENLDGKAQGSSQRDESDAEIHPPKRRCAPFHESRLTIVRHWIEACV